jgi:hypothetical protein
MGPSERRASESGIRLGDYLPCSGGGSRLETSMEQSGTFSATFFLAYLAAVELEGVVLDEI